MKKILTILFFLFFQNVLFGQKNINSSNPFRTNLFIENFGQFNSWAKATPPIKYAVNSSDKIFFTQQGVIFKLETRERIDEKKFDRSELNENEKMKSKTYFVVMNWLGSNLDVIVKADNPSENYYTFGEKGYENIKARGYNKIIYKNLYPNIDVEYIIPEKGGIKYQLILYPGADLSVVKMNYSGDVSEIITDNDGNIVVKTPVGNITDHAPKSFYDGYNDIIFSAFSLKEKVISFKLKTSTPIQKTLIIDPWTTTPTSLTTDNAAYDIDFDNYGNVYVSGGVAPFKLAKYSSSGNLLWTFTNPLGWSSDGYYSKFCILPKSGTSYVSEGFNVSGPMVMKINSAGLLMLTSANFVGNNEIWTMFYNGCSGQLMGFGGGTGSLDNLQIISDTNLTSNTNINFNGYTGSCCNDIASAKMDYNGDFYALVTSSGGTTTLENRIQKSLMSANYNPPPVWDINSGYNFFECYQNGIPGFSGSCGLPTTVRANALALNTSYLFSYDGKTLNAWNKSNGNSLGSIVVNSVYADGQNRTHEGITVDECNNVYVGGTNMVHVYTFNGSTFNVGTSITTNISNEVYDVKADGISGSLYISGKGFITTANVTSCNTSTLNIQDDVTSDCQSYASVTVSGGTPPYTYYWSNGATTSSISNVPEGTYTLSVSDNSCIVLKGTDIIQISGVSITLDSIPNVFTPNADNDNDVFFPLISLAYSGVDKYFDSYELKIFNRWGIKIFETTQPSMGWDGKLSSSNQAVEGVYYWTLNFKSNCIVDIDKLKGVVHLLR